MPATVHSAGHARQSLVTLEGGVLVELNEIRASHGLKPLKLNRELSAAARNHTYDMIAVGYFEHDSINGTPYWKRIQRFYPRSGKAHWSVGENLLWVGGDIAADKAVEAWMNSSGHRKNILSAGWREIGIAAVFSDTAAGEFGGRAVTLITTDFGVRV